MANQNWFEPYFEQPGLEKVHSKSPFCERVPMIAPFVIFGGVQFRHICTNQTSEASGLSTP
jgi:hypothetical protein